MFQKEITLWFMTLVILSGFSLKSSAIQIGDEVEINSGAVTALSCALNMQGISQILLCPPREIATGVVVYDLLEKQIYFIAEKNIYLYELEKAFGGGRIDLTGKVVDMKDIFPVVEVSEYSISPKPKPGNFKGCL